jgi:hypothetical protein
MASIATLACALWTLLAGVPANAEILVPDADYAGGAQIIATGLPPTVDYFTQGTSDSASAGLNNLSLGAEGAFDLFGGTDRFAINDPGLVEIRTLDNGGLWGHLASGEGTADNFAGDFIVDRGDDLFEGFTGGGSFSAITASHITVCPDFAPATISIRGSVTRTTPPVPEPNSLALTVVGTVVILLLRNVSNLHGRGRC